MFDQEKIEQGVRLLIEGIGEDADREGLVDTPKRVARMYRELCSGMDEDPKECLSKTFSCDNENIVIERDIPFYSTCEHHLMTFFGKAHIAYMPNGSVVGISKLARTVEIYARRLQIQERMTGQIADALSSNLNAKGVLVVVEAEHMCVSARGIKKPGSVTITSASTGMLKKDDNLRREVLSMLGQVGGCR